MTTAFILFISFGFLAFYGIRMVAGHKKKKREQLALASAFNHFVQHEKLCIDQSEKLHNRIIALDRRNKKLLLIDHTEGSAREACIYLPDIVSVEVVEEREEKNNNIRNLFLQLRQRRSLVLYRFCFYNKQTDTPGDLVSLSRRARYWKNRVDVHKYPGNVSLEQEYVL